MSFYDDVDMSDVEDEGDLSQITDITLRQRNSSGPTPIHAFESPNKERSLSPQPPSVYLVLDTNFIISHLRLLTDIQQLHNVYGDAYRILVPKQVIAELDGLKSARDSMQVAKLARAAIDWCYTNLQNNDPVVRGQKLYECVDRDTTKDDSILDCCTYFKREHPDSLVILMSDDKNLCVKALTNSILTISYRQGMTADLIASKVVMESQNGQSRDDDEMMDDEAKESVETKLESGSDTTPFDVGAEIYPQVEQLVIDAVNYAVTSTFGDDADLIGYNSSKIHTLRDACYEIRHLGISTFGDYFHHRATYDPVRALEGKLNEFSSIPRTSETCKTFVEFWSRFLQGVYKSRDAKLQADLGQIIALWDTRVKNL